jgi:hypothetical protein
MKLDEDHLRNPLCLFAAGSTTKQEERSARIA